MRSLNQIFDVLNDFADNHYQINSFNRGDVNDIGFNNDSYKNFNYPMMWVQDPSLSISGKDDVLNFSILFCDIEYPDKKTQQEILSDMLEVGRDLISYLYDINLTGGFEFTIDRTVSAEPFLESYEDNLTGYIFTIALRQAFTYDRCQIPLDGATGTSESVVTIYDSDGVTVLTTVPCGGRYTVSAPSCADATVNVNGSLFNTVASGGTLNVPVVNEDDGQVGTIISGQVVIANSDISINGTLAQEVLAEDSQNILVTNTDNTQIGTVTGNVQIPDSQITVNSANYSTTPATVTGNVSVEYEDTTDVGTISGGRVVIPDNRFNSANPYKTGQTTSYASGDDGDLERGRGTNFTTLDHNNPYGNTTRFLDELGGTSFANGVYVDWATANYVGQTVLVWQNTLRGGAGINFADSITASAALTIISLTGWTLPNASEAFSIIDHEQASAPLTHIGINSIANPLWTTTTRADNTTLARIFNTVTTPLGNANKSNPVALYIVCRYFTFAELGL